jgi:hypothetical protein
VAYRVSRAGPFASVWVVTSAKSQPVLLCSSRTSTMVTRVVWNDPYYRQPATVARCLTSALPE